LRDSVGQQDFALRYNGGHVIYNLMTPNQSTSTPSNGPIVALDDDLRVGRCWRFDGCSGQLGIALSERISISHITIDHVTKELVLNIRQAPQMIILWGV
ncbi:hypothetical protein L208DRAFT_1007924, partial [Tricholoma matsutake]